MSWTRDFLPSLVEGIVKYKDRWVGVPYDIPIFIMIYRKDIYMTNLGLKAPAALEELYTNSKAITEEMGPTVYGTSGQMKAGHYSLECDWTAWLWGHGGSIFGPEKKFAGNDEKGLAAMDYWTKLKGTMPPDVDGWTWDGESQSLAQGVAAAMLSGGEFFPYLDDQSQTKVSGLCEVAVPPQAISLRTGPGDQLQSDSRRRAPGRLIARGFPLLEKPRRRVAFHAVGDLREYSGADHHTRGRHRPDPDQRLRRSAGPRERQGRGRHDPPPAGGARNHR